MKYKLDKEKMYNWGFIAIIAVIIITIGGGIFAFRFYMLGGFKNAADITEYSRYYAMITSDYKSSFWRSVYEGAYERGLENDTYVDIFGENMPRDYTREDMMRIAIASGVDGIIVTADESEEMTQLINDAAEQGIPVVTLYGDNTQSARCSFVGVGSYNLGREYGRQVLKIAEEKDKQSIKAAVLVNSHEHDSRQTIISSGIQDAIAQEKAEEINIDISLVAVDDTNAFSAEESIRDIFMENELPDIIICLDELNTTCVYQSVVDYNRVGQVNILGYYDSETIINAIDRNVIYATISIDTKQMGEFCVDALTEYYDIGNTSQYFTADITLVNKDNVINYVVNEQTRGENEDY